MKPFSGNCKERRASSNTPPLNKADRALSDAFDKLFDAADPDTGQNLGAGAREAHRRIVDAYLKNTGKTNWITFSTIGTTWSDLVRSAIAEFIQYGNSHATAAYFQAFDDGSGKPLDASTHGYVLTFTKSEEHSLSGRFWSVTAYIPDTMRSTQATLKKYLVGSYRRVCKKAKTDRSPFIWRPRNRKAFPRQTGFPFPGGFQRYAARLRSGRQRRVEYVRSSSPFGSF